ncbi:uncharacterized protein LOC113289833 isoform X2 [Papaver somniferum]|uniref:uncharacterized protein LOC113289833 isoform X2 n=1 Tax=Papaver somniferum TaxID=3469 RepID=UPI000E6FD52D|nr:uncharacterized protein LOC113289833 isoform X2 [Papaver somniferum]
MNIRYRLRCARDGSLKITRSEIKEPSIDLKSSLKMFFQVAACDAHDWTDVNRSYRDRRSFPMFLGLLKLSGLGKYAFNEDTFLQDDDMNIRYPQDRYWLPHKVSPDVVVANKYYDGSFSLMRLLQRIRSESADHFRKEQQEQRFISKSFSEHLEQLRKSGEVAFSSNPFNDDDGDRPKCPIISSDNTMDSYMWQQKHLLDSLCIMSHESVWLLKKLKDSPFTSPSSILEFNKILDIVLVFIPKFKKSKVKLFGTATNDQLDQIRLSIDELLTVGESVLVEFIAMHKTVAEVSYMLGDDFTTGGAGMRGLSDVTHPCKHNDQLMDFNPEDFPWDKHNVPSSTIDPNSKDFPEDYE